MIFAIIYLWEKTNILTSSLVCADSGENLCNTCRTTGCPLKCARWCSTARVCGWRRLSSAGAVCCSRRQSAGRPTAVSGWPTVVCPTATGPPAHDPSQHTRWPTAASCCQTDGCDFSSGPTSVCCPRRHCTRESPMQLYTADVKM